MSTAMKFHPAPAPFEKLPPHDIQAEAALVGSLYMAAKDRPDLFAQICTIADETDFQVPENAMIVTAIRDLHRAGKTVDEVTLPDLLRKRDLLEAIGGVSYLAECVNSMPSAAGGPHYAEIVHENAQLRRIIEVLGDITARAYEPAYGEEKLSLALIGQIRQAVDELTSRVSEDSVTFAQAVDQTMAELEGEGVRCLPTGFRDIDAAFGGFGYGEDIIIAARPSMGKSLFSRMIAVNNGMHDRPFGIIAAEESRQKIIRNALSWFTGFDNKRIRLGRVRGHFRDEEWQRVQAHANSLRDLPIYIADNVWDLDRICAMATAWKARHGIHGLIVDHIGLVRAAGKTPYERMSLTSTTLKQLYKQLGVVGISVAQLNRSNTNRGPDDNRPRLSDLRDSGRIEEDADGVIMVHREDYYHRNEQNYTPTSEAEIIFAKWRDGDTSQLIRLRTHMATQHFSDRHTYDTEVEQYGL